MTFLLYILIGYCILSYLFVIFLFINGKEYKKIDWKSKKMYYLKQLFAPVSIIVSGFELLYYMFKSDENIEQPEEQEHKYEKNYSSIRLKNIPFVSEHNQVIYVESSYNDLTNKLIRENYDLICGLFHHHKMEFVYLPIDSSMEVMKKRVAITNGNIDITDYPDALKSDYLLDFMSRPENRGNIPPCLIWYEEYDEELEEYVFQIFRFPDSISSYEDFKKLADAVSYKLYDIGSLRFRIMDDDRTEEEIAEEKAKEERELKIEIEEFKKSAERLASKGITQMMLHRILADIVPLSPIVITPDYRIILPGFDNKEVELTYLQKALYFLFLRYPEGIVLKHMQEHNLELYNIYAQLNTSAKEEKMRQTIKELTYPLSNRLHENITRIKAAFLKVVDQYAAQKYIVDGSKGELYRITIDRDLVEWQE